MRDYKTVPTSAEVWSAIRKRHPEMRVFGTYSAPEGSHRHPGIGKMFTSYGFGKGDYPVIEAESTWNLDRERPFQRPNLKHKYWLCLPVKEEDEA